MRFPKLLETMPLELKWLIRRYGIRFSCWPHSLARVGLMSAEIDQQNAHGIGTYRYYQPFDPLRVLFLIEMLKT